MPDYDIIILALVLLAALLTLVMAVALCKTAARNSEVEKPFSAGRLNELSKQASGSNLHDFGELVRKRRR